MFIRTQDIFVFSYYPYILSYIMLYINLVYYPILKPLPKNTTWQDAAGYL